MNTPPFRRHEAADRPYHGPLRMLVLDWAGTTVDFGSCAPAEVFVEIFRRRSVPITAAQARGPMGMAKRDHIRAVASLPDVASRWHDVHGRDVTEEDVDAMYGEFLPLQKEVLQRHCQLIPGTAEVTAACRDRGLKIASSTGYTPELMEVVIPAAREQGYEPDTVICAGDTPSGRPAPLMCYLAAVRLDCHPMAAVVKVDDTTVGIEAGRNAGCWTVGIVESGNLVGLSQQDLRQLPSAERQQRIERAEQALADAGAHYTIATIADLLPVLDDIAARIAAS